MKLCQYFLPRGGKRVGVVQDGRVVDITSRPAKVASVLDLIVQGRSAAGVERLARRLMKGKRPQVTLGELEVPPSPRRGHLLAPLDPPEVWGAGITYRRSADYYTAHRGRALLYEGKVTTGEMKRRCPELVDWLRRDNPIPAGTVLSTGTGILVPDEHALRNGDLVEVEIAGIGVLRNPVKKLG